MIALGVLASARVEAPPSDYASTVLADSPLAYWRLGEASGTTAADASGNSRSGSYVGTYTLAQPGAVAGDTAVAFNLGRVDVTYGAWMNVGTFTAEALIKTTQATKGAILYRDDGSGNRIFQFYVLNSGKLGALAWNSAESLVSATSTASVNNGAWHHVAFTVDGTTIRLYVDGIESGTAAQGAGRTDRARLIEIGRNSTSEPFIGTLDEVAYYSGALSAARILAHAQAAGVA